MSARRAVALAMAASTLAACGLGDKQAMADAIAESGYAIVASSPVRGELTVALDLDTASLETLEGAQRDDFAAALSGLGDLGGAAGPQSVQAVYDVTADFRDRLASVRAVDEPVATFDDGQIYVRRQNARSTEKRVWATLDLSALTKDEQPLLTRELRPADLVRTIALAVNPSHLVDLTAGALAGSTVRVGSESLDGTAVTRYEAKVALEQALDSLDLTDEESETRLRLHDLLRTRREVMPATFWIDGEGRLRQVSIEFSQRVSRRRSNTLVVTLHLTEVGVDATIPTPSPDLTVSYETFARLVRSGYPEAR